MDEDDAVGLALLRVGGRHDKPHVEARDGEQHRDPAEQAGQFARQGIERGGRGETEPVDCCHVIQKRF